MPNKLSISELFTKSQHVHRFVGHEYIGKRSSIAEHTLEVVLYAIKLANAAHRIDGHFCVDIGQVVTLASVHDLPEVFTGDIPYPIKRDNPVLKNVLKDAEASMMGDILKCLSVREDKLSSNSVINEGVVKLADTLAVSREILSQIILCNPDISEDYIDNCGVIFTNTLTTLRNHYVKDEDMLDYIENFAIVYPAIIADICKRYIPNDKGRSEDVCLRLCGLSNLRHLFV